MRGGYRHSWRYLLALLVFSAAAAGPPALTPRQQGEDFDALWRAVDRNYAYFDGGRAAWRKARDSWRRRAVGAQSRAELIAALEGLVATLRDDHASLAERTPGSPRGIPAETDIWAAWKNGAARVEAVRAFGDADVAGLGPGHVITRIDGVPVDQLVRDRLAASTASPAARDWALRHALAGPRQGVLRVEIAEGGGARTLEIERIEPVPSNVAPLVVRRMGEDRDLGYIRFKAGLADARVIDSFDAALDSLKNTRALILDLREASADGSRAVTRALLGRFITAPSPWQVREERGRGPITDTVEPRGEPYRAPLVVLVDRWTAGEGEALAAGLDTVAAARLVGTPMAGLRGELREVKLPHSGITLRFPAQKVFLVDGTPRELLRPRVEVNLAAPQGGPGDPTLYQALKILEKK